jgi:hypothetical protein
MSITITVDVPNPPIPALAEIVTVATSYGARLHFPAGFNPAKDLGFVPCMLNDQLSGFEVIREAETDGPQSQIRLSFEARSDYTGFAAAAIVSGAIALLTNGTLINEEDEVLAVRDVPAWIRTIDLPEPGASDELLKIPVVVVGPRGNSLLQLKLGKVRPGAHLARRLVESIPIENVPPGLRAPNSRFIILVRDAHEIVGVEPIAT